MPPASALGCMQQCFQGSRISCFLRDALQFLSMAVFGIATKDATGAARRHRTPTSGQPSSDGTGRAMWRCAMPCILLAGGSPSSGNVACARRASMRQLNGCLHGQMPEAATSKALLSDHVPASTRLDVVFDEPRYISWVYIHYSPRICNSGHVTKPGLKFDLHPGYVTAP